MKIDHLSFILPGRKLAVCLLFLLTLAVAVVAQTSIELVTRAKDEIANKKYDKAFTDLTQAISLDNNSFMPFRLRGNIYMMQKSDYAHAIVDFTRAIELFPTSPNGYAYRGRAYQLSDHFNEAIADFSTAIKLDPKYQYAYYTRGSCYLGVGDLNNALADYDRATELGPKDYAVTVNRGRIYMLQLKYDLAIAELNKVPADDKSYAKARSTLADIEKVKQRKGFSPSVTQSLWDAVLKNDTNTVRAALVAGADPNGKFTYYDIKDSTPLQRASYSGNYDAVEVLLAAGADPNLSDINGKTALHFLVTQMGMEKITNGVPIMRLLLKNGAKPDVQDTSGQTPLYDACVWPTVEGVQTLLAAGANVDLANKQRQTPLHLISRTSSPAITKALIAAHADLNTPDSFGYTPLTNAIYHNAAALKTSFMLIRGGASINLPADFKTDEHLDSISFAKRMKAMSSSSVEMKMFDAAADGDVAKLTNLLTAAQSVDKDILNVLLLMSVQLDDPDLLTALVAKGADRNPGFDGSTASNLAGKSPRSLAYLNNGAAPAITEANTEAVTDAKMAKYFDNATLFLKSASSEMAQATQMRKDGKNKGLVCVVMRRSIEDLRYARQNIEDAGKLPSLKYRAVMETLKSNLIDNEREIHEFGCN